MKLRAFIYIGLAAVMSAALFWHHRQPAKVNTVTEEKPQPLVAKAAPSMIQTGSPRKANPTTSPATIADQILDATADYNRREAAIKSLSAKTSKEDLDKLYNYLRGKDGQDGNQNGRVFKNELMDQLTELNPGEVSAVLAQLYNDHSQDPVLRDYALQHMIEGLQLQQALGQASQGQIDQLNQMLWSAVNETDSSIAGTALLGLSRLSQSNPAFNPSQVMSTATALVENNNAGELTQVTAMQVAAQMNDQTALPAILQIAQNGPTLPLQISAIGALGYLGGSDAKALLTIIANGNDPTLVPAALGALHRIKLNSRRS